MRESQADKTLRVGWIPGKYNIAELLTKTKKTINMRNGMLESIFYNKLVVIREKNKTKWKESNQNLGPLISNTSKYLLQYQKLCL